MRTSAIKVLSVFALAMCCVGFLLCVAPAHGQVVTEKTVTAAAPVKVTVAHLSRQAVAAPDPAVQPAPEAPAAPVQTTSTSIGAKLFVNGRGQVLTGVSYPIGWLGPKSLGINLTTFAAYQVTGGQNANQGAYVGLMAEKSWNLPGGLSASVGVGFTGVNVTNGFQPNSGLANLLVSAGIQIPLSRSTSTPAVARAARPHVAPGSPLVAMHLKNGFELGPGYLSVPIGAP